MPSDVVLNAVHQALIKTRTLVKGRWFQNQRIKLDGYHFEDCRFDECILYYDTSDFALTRCFLAQTTNVVHPDVAAKGMKLYFRRFQGSYDVWWPRFAPQRHENGTISVGGTIRFSPPRVGEMVGVSEA